MCPRGLKPEITIRAKPPQNPQKVLIPGIPTSSEVFEVLIEWEPVGTYPVQTKPEFINGVWTEGMNLTDGKILIPCIGLRRQERVAANNRSKKGRIRQRRVQEAVTGEELILVREAMVDPNIKVIHVVSYRSGCH